MDLKSHVCIAWNGALIYICFFLLRQEDVLILFLKKWSVSTTWGLNSAVTLAALMACLGSCCALADASFTRFRLSIVSPSSLLYLLSVSLCADKIQGKDVCQAQRSSGFCVPGIPAGPGELSQPSGDFAAAQAAGTAPLQLTRHLSRRNGCCSLPTKEIFPLIHKSSFIKMMSK